MASRIAGYFRGAANPALGIPARLLFALKSAMTIGVLGVLFLTMYTILLIPLTPSGADLRKAKVEQPSILMSADGKQLAVYKRLNREWVALGRVSPNVVNALIATEDHRFYEHYGIEPLRMVVGAARALVGDLEGGSTLTQQLARNLYPEEIGRQRTITRKLKEIVTALKIEQAYTKKEILETYLNTVPFLYNAFGIEMAARTYFDKPASKLTVLESATLIGMLKGTSYYNPVLNPERAVKRRNVVLSQMHKRGVLSRTEFDSLRQRPLRLDFERQPEPLGPAPHFAEHLRKWLVTWADRNDYNIYSDGLRIHATIDTRMQAAANRAVQRQMNALQAVADVEWSMPSTRLISTATSAYRERQSRIKPFAHFWENRDRVVDAFVRESVAYRRLTEAGTTAEEALAQLRKDTAFMDKLREDKTRLQASLVAIDPVTSHVKAWVGSRDFKTDQYDHVATARRQPGSTFKPFIYGAALEGGMSPTKEFMDAPIEIAMPDGTVWRPGDIRPPSGRLMTAREGLIHSKNTITARVLQETSPRKAAALARDMGVKQSRLDAVPALALGTSPVTTLEMVSAYSTLASGGEYSEPVLITHITDKAGNELARFAKEPERVMSEKTAEDLVDMLRGVVNQGTARDLRSRFGIRTDVAGKTGTTQDNTDGWFILMHPRLVTGTWVGFNDARVAMRSDYWGQGGHNALLVVGDFFRAALTARLIESGKTLPTADRSMFDPVLDIFREWFGKGLFGGEEQAPQKEAPPRQEAPRKPEKEKEEEGSVLDEAERIYRQAREVERTATDYIEKIDRIIRDWTN